MPLCSSLDKLKHLEVYDKSGLSGIITSVGAFLANYRDQVGGVLDSWSAINTVSVLDAINARIELYLHGRNKKSSGIALENWGRPHPAEEVERSRETAKVRNVLETWTRRYVNFRKSQFIRRMHDYLSSRRCYVPMLRGMRPPLASVISDRQGIDAADCWTKPLRGRFKPIIAHSPKYA